jgi:hypothetical protein
MNLSLVDAFGRFGAKPASRLRALSAITADGALVLNCSRAYFGHPSQGVLRYEDRLSREPGGPKNTGRLGQHLTIARDGALPVRMIVTSRTEEKGGTRNRTCHVRSDLIGTVVKFDGDHFVVDFKRGEAVIQAVTSRGARGES